MVYRINQKCSVVTDFSQGRLQRAELALAPSAIDYDLRGFWHMRQDALRVGTQDHQARSQKSAILNRNLESNFPSKRSQRFWKWQRLRTPCGQNDGNNFLAFAHPAGRGRINERGGKLQHLPLWCAHVFSAP